MQVTMTEAFQAAETVVRVAPCPSVRHLLPVRIPVEAHLDSYFAGVPMPVCDHELQGWHWRGPEWNCRIGWAFCAATLTFWYARLDERGRG